MSQFSQRTDNEDIDASQFDELFMPYKRQRYGSFRRSQAARRIQSSYRRYRRAGSTDQRQLRSVVRSYRKANPYQITPSSGRTVTFWRKTQVNMELNQLTGFAAAGGNVNWGFSLGRIVGFVSGVFTFSTAVPSSSEFQALFDYYKINAVKMQIFFTKNTDPVASATGTSHGLPLLIIVNDFDDIAESMGFNDMNQRVGARHVQFDSNNTNGITHYIKPKPTSVIVATDVTTGTLAASNSGVTFGTQWIDCAQSNIVHNGIKIVYDSQGLVNNVNLGRISFIFDVEYVFKGYR